MVFPAFFFFFLKLLLFNDTGSLWQDPEENYGYLYIDMLYKTAYLPCFSIHSWKIDSKYLQLFLLHVNAKIGSENRKTVYKCRLIFTF